MRSRGLLYPALLLVPALCVHVLVSRHMLDTRKPRSDQELSVALPAEVQVFLSFGDRYLATNIGAFRVMTGGTNEMQPETYASLAKIQVEAARLNPRHEDNYYTAAAILPWGGQLDPAQQVLQLATQARTNDPLPPFFHGFNRYYFHRDYVGAGQDMLIAAARSEPVNKAALTGVAAKWIERGYDPKQAIAMLDGLSAGSNNPRLKRLLQARSERLRGLMVLQEAVGRFKQAQQRPPSNLGELVHSGTLAALPVDPLGKGYALSPQGEPQFQEAAK